MADPQSRAATCRRSHHHAGCRGPEQVPLLFPARPLPFPTAGDRLPEALLSLRGTRAARPLLTGAACPCPGASQHVRAQRGAEPCAEGSQATREGRRGGALSNRAQGLPRRALHLSPVGNRGCRGGRPSTGCTGAPTGDSRDSLGTETARRPRRKASVVILGLGKMGAQMKTGRLSREGPRDQSAPPAAGRSRKITGEAGPGSTQVL